MPDPCGHPVPPARSPVWLALGLLLLTARVPAQVLLFAAEDDWYPYSGVRNGQTVGMAADIVRTIYERDGVQVHFQPLSYSRCMEVARTPQYAGCFTTSRNDQFDPYYLYARQPLLEGQIRIYSRANSPEHDLRLKSLEGRTVGVVLTYGYSRDFDENPAIRKEFSTREINAFRKLKAGRIPYVVAWEGTANVLIRQDPGLRGWIKPVGWLASGPVFVSFSKRYPDAEALVQQFDDGMTALRKSGRLRQLAAKWGVSHGIE